MPIIIRSIATAALAATREEAADVEEGIGISA
jgi:hypothetical protein